MNGKPKGEPSATLKAVPKPVHSNGKRFSDQTLVEAARRRSNTRTVDAYLTALERDRLRGTRSPERIQAKLDALEAELSDDPAPYRRVVAIQERMDLETELRSALAKSDLPEREAAAIEVLGEWADAKGVSYAALREGGIPAHVLKAAGITRTRSVT
jgi:hypothetical protein